MRSSAASRIFGALCLTVSVAACADAPIAPATPPDVAPSASTSGSPSTGIPTGKIVIVFKDTATVPAEGLALVQSLGGIVTSRFDEVGVAFATGLSVDALTRLASSDLVEDVGADRIIDWLPGLRIGGAVEDRSLGALGQDPTKARFYADGTQWNMRVIQADKAWAAGYQGASDTRVAILDTGIDYDHRELRGLVDPGASASFSELIVAEAGLEATVPVEPQQPGDFGYMDNHFHGTHVASTVASHGISVAAVAPRTTLIAVKVLNFLGSGTFESVATGIRHAAGPANADVINMSLGANVDQTEAGVPALLKMMARVIREAEKKGAIVISAAGNDALDLDVGTLVSTPCEQSTVCVSATGPLLQQDFDQAATYTNYGITAIHVAAPGGNASDDGNYVTKDLVIGACSRRSSSGTLNVCRGNTDGVAYFYAYAAGTSMAAPHASGVAALVKSRYPTLSVNGLRSRLLQTADDIGERGRDIYSNYGRVNAWRALGEP